MAHFAKVIDGKVVQVIVADQDFIDNNPPALGTWIQTSYNTHGGQHIHPVTKEINTKPQLRKNFAGIGYKYDKQLDAFIPPKPFNTWELNEETCLYEAPQEHPNDGKNYRWDENEFIKNNNGWIEIQDPN